MELRIILKDPADGDPLDTQLPGVWGDYATIGWKLTYDGEDYGDHIEIKRGVGYETFEAGVLMLKQAFATMSALAEDKANE